MVGRGEVSPCAVRERVLLMVVVGEAGERAMIGHTPATRAAAPGWSCQNPGGHRNRGDIGVPAGQHHERPAGDNGAGVDHLCPARVGQGRGLRGGEDGLPA